MQTAAVTNHRDPFVKGKWLNLRPLLENKHIQIKQVATRINDRLGIDVHRSTLAKHINGTRRADKITNNIEPIQLIVDELLAEQGCTENEIKSAWLESQPKPKRANKQGQETLPEMKIAPELTMLMPKVLKHFRLMSDPWSDEAIQSPDDLFMQTQQHEVRETMIHAVRTSSILTVIGESGSGKTTTKLSFIGHVQECEPDWHVIQPQYTKVSKLTHTHIEHALMHALGLKVRVNNAVENQTRLIQQELSLRLQNQQKFVILLEEAHRLSDDTLRELKQLHEWKDGFRRLLSFILIGQSELSDRLAHHQIQVREFSSRATRIEMYPLGDALSDYIAFKLGRVGADVNKVISPDGIKALRQRLLIERKTGIQRSTELVDHSYPQRVHNWMTAAMQKAHELGEPTITPEIIKLVREAM